MTAWWSVHGMDCEGALDDLPTKRPWVWCVVDRSSGKHVKHDPIDHDQVDPPDALECEVRAWLTVYDPLAGGNRHSDMGKSSPHPTA